ncbi:MAG: tetratricopeptide repeat protein [Deltaproteobacteria bacterium]|nr:tetratricopeptide repeat protein [Deltaproteobacteria bacterium]
MRRGRALFDEGNYVRAHTAFQRARTLVPANEDASLRADLAAVAVVAQTPEAISDANINELDYTLDVLAPRQAENAHLSLTARGNLLARAGRRDEAVSEYRKALAAHAEFVPALFFMAQVLEQSGKTGEADASLRTVVKVDPRHVPAREMLAVLLSRRGAHDEAIQVLRDGMTLGGGLRLQVALGTVSARAGRPNDAESAFREALKQDPDLPAALYGLGGLLLNGQNPSEGRGLLARYVEVAPSRGEPPLRVADVRNALGQMPAQPPVAASPPDLASTRNPSPRRGGSQGGGAP